MTRERAWKLVAGLRPDGRLEDLARRWGVPHAPEFEAGLFRRLFAAELRAALAAFARAETAEDLARRGRLRRLLGDPEAARDLHAALAADPRCARAHAWLGEADLAGPGALASLDQAVALAASDGWPRTYRGAARLLRGDCAGAGADLAAASKLLPREALPRLLAGLALSRLGRREPADRAFRQALALEPSCSAAALLRSKLWSGARAARAAEEALDAEPDHAHVALFAWKPGQSWERWLARHVDFCLRPERILPLCTRYGQDETRFSPYHFEAVALAESTLALRGQRAWTLATYGRALARAPGGAARRPAARRALDAAAAANPGVGWTWAWRALARLGLEPAAALADLDRALTLSPHYFRAYAWRGALLRKLGRLKEGLADLDRAVAGEERYPFSSHERSLARRDAGDWVGAALDLDRAYGIDARYSWVYAGDREPSLAERRDGLAELDKAVARHPSCVSLRAWRGDLLLKLGRTGPAVLALGAAAAMDPAHALAQGFLGLALLEAGRPEPAVERLKRSVALDCRHLALRAGWAAALRRVGRRAAAEKVLEETLRARPKAWTARLQRARWRLDDGKPVEGLAEARAAAGLEGRDAEAYLLEARALSALKRWTQAGTAVERALAIAPNNGRAYVLRAEIRRALGRADDAVADFRIAFERFPHLFNADERGRAAALLQEPK